MKKLGFLHLLLSLKKAIEKRNTLISQLSAIQMNKLSSSTKLCKNIDIF